jgi:hypothetical protein
VKRPAAILGAGFAATVAMILALTAWARCLDLGPRVEVHPAIRAWDAGRR